MAYLLNRISLAFLASFLLVPIGVNAAEVISIPWNANPAEYSSIGIIGEIKAGDAQKFEQILQQSKPDISVYLWSPGGDLLEAMKIGHRIRSTFLHTHSPRPNICLGILRSSQDFDWWPATAPRKYACQCDSACFAIWAAGVSRSGYFSYRDSNEDRKAMLGIHRPRFDSKYFSGLSAVEAEDRYSEMLSQFSAYMLDMDVPESLIEKILVIPSDEVRYLSQPELDSLNGRIPAIEEWIRSKCGGLTDEEAAEHLVFKNRKWDIEANRHNVVPLSKAEEFYFQHLDERWLAALDCEYQVFVDEQTRRLGGN